jgi:4-aminobutyrate aminotransferase-like enzyme
MRALIGAGLFAVAANHDPSALQFKPPLVTSDEEADEMIALVRRVLG